MKLAVRACVLFAASGEASEAQMFPSLRKHLLQVRRQQERQQEHQAAVDDSDDIDDTNVAPTQVAEGTSVAVPAATSQGPDGYLPGVTDMLGGATKTLQSITSEAAVLQAQLAQKEKDNQQHLANKKATFEQKLKVQEAGSRDVTAANTKIEAEIEAVKANNTQLRQEAKQLEKANHLMRTQLHFLEAKFGDVRVFANDSLAETDDSHAKELDVLRAHKKKLGLVVRRVTHVDNDKDEDDDSDDDHDGDDKDDDSDDKDDDKANSFLEIGESMEFESDAPEPTAPPADPKGLVEILRNGVEQLAKEGRESEQKLHAMFVANFKAGIKRHEALLLKQKSLIAQRTQLQQLQEQLTVADRHLAETGKKLQERLRGLGLFVQKLAHLAMAPTSEVSRLMENLPESPRRAEVPQADN